MTPIEAINKIQYRIDTANRLVGNNNYENEFEDLELAKKFLSKQIPVKLQRFKDTDSYCCTCGYCVGKPFVQKFYCMRCGQVLTK